MKNNSSPQSQSKMPMDVLDAASFGYRLVWAERRYLARLAAIPLVVTFLCQMAVTGLQLEFQFLRQALVMLPAYFAEGWVVCHLVRLIFLGQRWPFTPSGDPARDEQDLDDRAYGVFAGTLVYVLIKFAIAGALVLVVDSRMADGPEAVASVANDANHAQFLMQVGIIIFAVWAFRLMWVNIGVAAGYSVQTYVRATHGFGVSVQMLAVSLLCTLPIFMVMMFFTAGLVADAHQQGIPVPTIVQALVTLMNSVGAMVMVLVNAAGLTWGIGRLIAKYFGRRPV